MNSTSKNAFLPLPSSLRTQFSYPTKKEKESGISATSKVSVKEMWKSSTSRAIEWEWGDRGAMGDLAGGMGDSATVKVRIREMGNSATVKSSERGVGPGTTTSNGRGRRNSPTATVGIGECGNSATSKARAREMAASQGALRSGEGNGRWAVAHRWGQIY